MLCSEDQHKRNLIWEGGRIYVVHIAQTPAQVQYKYGHIVIIITELRVHNVPLRTHPPWPHFTPHSPRGILTFHSFPSSRNISQEVIFITVSQKWHGGISHRNGILEVTRPLALQEMRDFTQMERGVWSMGEGQPYQLNKKYYRDYNGILMFDCEIVRDGRSVKYCRKSHSIPGRSGSGPPSK